MKSSISSSNYRSIGWSLLDRFGTQAIGFGFSIFLTRLLDPRDFGLIGMILVFMALGQALVDSGMTSSLIRKKETDSLDFSVVFLGNLLFSLAVYTLIFLVAPWISDFYAEPTLTLIIRVYGLGFLFIALSAIQQTVLVKQMNFRKLTQIRLPAMILSGLIALIAAYQGLGVWSLVLMYLVNQVLLTALFWIFGNWRFRFDFEYSRFREHFSFGYKLSLASILNTVFDNIYHVIIGKFFAVSTLGFYTRAHMMKQYPVETFASALQKVTYPMFAEFSEDKNILRSHFKELSQRVIFIMAPMMILGSALAEPLFQFLFGTKWLEAVPYFQILCFTGILYPIHSYNLNILNVFGRSDLFLRLEIIKKFQVVLLILVAFQFGLIPLLWAQVVSSLTSFAINTYYTGRFLDYGFWSQIKDIFPVILIGLLIGFVIWRLVMRFESIELESFLQLASLLPLGLILYFLLSLACKVPAARDSLNFMRYKFAS
ncbi:lipopolysaccharide biosynthesis protein [Algoriphagus namhaensis]